MASKALVTLTALPGLQAAAAAQGAPLPVTGEQQVNVATAGDQDSPAVGMSDDGQHVVVWRSAGQDANGSAIVYRQFPGDGSVPFNEAVLNQVTAGDQLGPAIGMNAGGDWLAVWRTSPNGQGIRGRATFNNGASFGSEFQASVNTVAPQIPAASRADNDTSVATWDSDGAFRRFDAFTSALSADVNPAPSFPHPARLRVASGPLGDFVIAFQDVDADQQGVFAQRFAADGTPLGDVIPLAESADDAQTFVDVGMAADGSFVATWVDAIDGFRARCFDAAGEPRSGEIPVHTGTSGAPRIAVAPGGAFAVTFSAGEIALQEYDRICHPVGAQFTVNTTTSGFQNEPAVAAGADRFAVVWHSANLDGNGLAIARRLYRFRSIFADDFESNDPAGWSSVVP